MPARAPALSTTALPAAPPLTGPTVSFVTTPSSTRSRKWRIGATPGPTDDEPQPPRTVHAPPTAAPQTQ
eukprot:1663396-Rhodomonas_salina.1